MSKLFKNNGLTQLSAISGATPVQQQLFHVEKQVEIDGVEMGVLESGVPFLSGRGLERMCGLGHGPFYRLTINWNDEKTKPRGREIQKILEQYNYREDSLFLNAEFNGREVNAFPEPVCMALLQYYAFVADEPREQAKNAFITLARTKFTEYIYQAVGYHPNQKNIDSWKHFHDRIDLTTSAVPDGFFCIFTEIASMIVPMIRAGFVVSDKVIPDISVGRAWSDFWVKNSLAEKYGERDKYEHYYPDYYPQSKSNPQAPYAYPDSALPVFRSWLKQNYIINNFPKYLLNQVGKKSIGKQDALKLISLFETPELPNKY
ncbi:hypothetical protein [Xenorhabdus griffiniae]|uniref:BstA-like C-terminal domain-containing protein n=1 Tax=Xenorhabdus griffiniae TaxID=351672 RepID=A0ABY9XKQ8_9GAMM|nr:hypothetical protein [Xenorhabdus griffiniae]MBD1229234.1 hypothetical protein [Xenorhabdus griffiniae]MBE8588991.1 hypothetical protein [Xenorhabdus griffiniae]WMV73510.1 hypothetical protein QL128_05665 [Xenorhabdus griffiniae]WNH03190.1 hypothetical protein QL112_005670 [Xenorhabdus griffiniae]